VKGLEVKHSLVNLQHCAFSVEYLKSNVSLIEN